MTGLEIVAARARTVYATAIWPRARIAWRYFDHLSPNARGILAMLGAMAAFSFGDALMKVAAMQFPTGQAILMRGIMASAAIWYVAVRTGAAKDLSVLRNPYLTWRTLGDAFASFFFITALSKLQLADVSAIMQTSPLAVTAGAAIFLGETVGWRRWTATGVGFLGALLIVQPGSAEFSWASLLVLGAVFAATMRDLVTRFVPAVPVTLVIAAAVTATTLLSVLFIPFEIWRMPKFWELLVLAAAGVFMMTGQALVVISVRSGDVSAVVPFRYSAIIWSLLLSFLIWQYVPNKTTMLGILIISGAGLYTFFREQTLKRHGKLA